MNTTVQSPTLTRVANIVVREDATNEYILGIKRDECPFRFIVEGCESNLLLPGALDADILNAFHSAAAWACVRRIETLNRKP